MHTDCNYEKDRPERDMIRKEMWDIVYGIDAKTEDLTIKIAALKDLLMDQLAANVEEQEKCKNRDIEQDAALKIQGKCLEELSIKLNETLALTQENSAMQHMTDIEVKELKNLFSELKGIVNSFRDHLDNGWRSEFIEMQTERMYDLFEKLGEKVLDKESDRQGREYNLMDKKEDRKTTSVVHFFKFLGTLFTIGGVGYLLVERLLLLL